MKSSAPLDRSNTLKLNMSKIIFHCSCKFLVYAYIPGCVIASQLFKHFASWVYFMLFLTIKLERAITCCFCLITCVYSTALSFRYVKSKKSNHNSEDICFINILFWLTFLRTKDTSDNKNASGRLTSEIWPDSGVFCKSFSLSTYVFRV